MRLINYICDVFVKICSVKRIYGYFIVVFICGFISCSHFCELVRWGQGRSGLRLRLRTCVSVSGLVS